jgi:radical SAM superfamily enzyme YgiQ (UPF0313 family)
VEAVLGFPNRYAVGMSNLGFQTVFSLMRDLEGVRCERTFLWESGGSGTLESGRPLRQFSLAAFSVPFELDYTNLLEILQRAQIPLLASLRGEDEPIVAMGGPCAFLNPEPMAPFVDLFVIGEAEGILPDVLKVIKEDGSKRQKLESCARIPGVYVPRLYEFSYRSDGSIRAFQPLPPAPRRVVRQWTPDLDSFATVSDISTPLSHFKDMTLVEVQRGCAYRCRFCAMGQLYRPLRHRSREILRSHVRLGGERGKRVGLVGSAVADLPGLLDVCRQMAGRELELGISSLRADRLTPELIAELSRLGMKTLTVAPEVGSDRLRRVIAKSVASEDVLRTASLAAEAGIPNLKLYFMVGLPWETEEDVAAIISLAAKVSRVSARQKLTVSVSPFVPKAVTPFQWAPMEARAGLQKKMKYLAQEVRSLKGTSFIGEGLRRSLWQAVLARGDRRVGMVLWHHVESRLAWAKSWQQMGLRPDFFSRRERPREEILPWDIIDHGVDKESLWGEYQRAKESAMQTRAARE